MRVSAHVEPGDTAACYQLLVENLRMPRDYNDIEEQIMEEVVSGPVDLSDA